MAATAGSAPRMPASRVYLCGLLERVLPAPMMTQLMSGPSSLSCGPPQRRVSVSEAHSEREPKSTFATLSDWPPMKYSASGCLMTIPCSIGAHQCHATALPAAA